MAFNFGRAVKDWWQADIRKPAFKAKATLEPGADFEGKLTILPGTPVRLNSHFKGEIAGEGTILVAERGEVEANIACKSILVLGKVAGSVRAIEGVEIKKRAVVLGNLTTPLLIVEPGGYFDGQCHMPTERSNKHAEETAADHSAAVTQPETAILHR